ncbi:MAG: hypothetical protein ACRDRP_08275 [Pseudonocardiaceae bacterium]
MTTALIRPLAATPAPCPAVRGTREQGGGPVNRDMAVLVSAGVDADVEIALYSPRRPEDDTVTIFFGAEQVTLQFYDVGSLERLRDVADEGARRLRAVLAANDRADDAGPVASGPDVLPGNFVN